MTERSAATSTKETIGIIVRTVLTGRSATERKTQIARREVPGRTGRAARKEKTKETRLVGRKKQARQKKAAGRAEIPVRSRSVEMAGRTEQSVRTARTEEIEQIARNAMTGHNRATGRRQSSRKIVPTGQTAPIARIGIVEMAQVTDLERGTRKQEILHQRCKSLGTMLSVSRMGKHRNG